MSYNAPSFSASSPPAHPNLPHDILFEIFSSLSTLHEVESPWSYGPRNADLRSCALVSHAWNANASRVLYGRIGLAWRKDSAELLLQTLEANPILLRNVRSLAVSVVSWRLAMTKAIAAHMQTPEMGEPCDAESLRPRYNHDYVARSGTLMVAAGNAPNIEGDGDTTVTEDEVDDGCECDECVDDREDVEWEDDDLETSVKKGRRRRLRQHARFDRVGPAMCRRYQQKLEKSGFQNKYWDDKQGQPELLAFIARLSNLSRLAVADCDLTRYLDDKAAVSCQPLIDVLSRLSILVTSDVRHLADFLHHIPLLSTLEINGRDSSVSYYYGVPVPPFPPLSLLQHLRFDSSPLSTSIPPGQYREPDQKTILALLRKTSTSLLTLEFGAGPIHGSEASKAPSYLGLVLLEIEAPLLRHLSLLNWRWEPDDGLETLYHSFATFITACSALKTLLVNNRKIFDHSFETLPPTLVDVCWIPSQPIKSQAVQRGRLASRSDVGAELVLGEGRLELIL